MSLTGKAAGWLAGRLRGERARKKTMDWMEKTGLGKALSIGGDIGIGLAGGKLAKMGAAGLKGMFAGGGAGAAGAGGAAGGGGTPYDALMGGGGGGASAAGRAAGGGSFMGRLGSLATNPQVLSGVAGGVADVMGQRAQQRIEEQRMAQQGSQFQQQFDAGEEERRRQREQANRLAAFFMPRAQG